jgi:hypothetical protein
VDARGYRVENRDALVADVRGRIAEALA